MDEHLMVNCKNASCGKPFRSPIQLDRGSLAASTLTNNSYQCPHCGQANVYEKEDHSFAEGG